MGAQYLILIPALLTSLATAALALRGRGAEPLAVELEEAVTLFVSDIHYREGDATPRLIAGLVRRLGAGRLVVLGDLFDDLHRPLTPDELGRCVRGALSPVLERVDEMIYVVSGGQHDPIVPGTLRLDLGPRVLVTDRPLYATIGGQGFLLTHGDVAILNGAVAYAVNRAARVLGCDLFLEKALRARFRLGPRDWLIMGHTHLPGIDGTWRVANTGCWKRTWALGLRYWRRPTFTAVVYDLREVRLVKLEVS